LFASGTAPGTLDIFSMDVEGRHVHPFVSSSADELMPAWSPDGKRIAFVRETPSGYHLFVKSGAGAAKRMSLQAFAFFPDWSPDGKRIAFSGADELGFIRYKGPPSSRNIFVIDLASRSVTKLTDDDAYDTSPDWR
jgi:TolB protein